MSEKTKRFENIDLLKCLSIFFVLIIHGSFLPVDFWNKGSMNSYLYYFFRTILSTSVPLFFVCNGFLLFRKPLDLKKHVNRTVHIIVTTYIWSFITIVLLMPIKGEWLNFSEIIRGINELKHGWINHLWFMGALGCIYVIFPLIKSAADHDKKILAYFVAVSGVLITVSKCLEMLATITGRDGIQVQLFRKFSPFEGTYDWAYFYFVLGGLISLYYEDVVTWIRGYAKKWKLLCIGAVVGSCSGLFVYGVLASKRLQGHWDVVWNGYESIFTMVSVTALFILSINYKPKKENWFTKVIHIVGSNTLGIYFIHEIFTYMTLEYVRSIALLSNFLGQILYVLVILVISTVVTLLLRKIPVLNQLVK